MKESKLKYEELVYLLDIHEPDIEKITEVIFWRMLLNKNLVITLKNGFIYVSPNTKPQQDSSLIEIDLFKNSFFEQQKDEFNLTRLFNGSEIIIRKEFENKILNKEIQSSLIKNGYLKRYSFLRMSFFVKYTSLGKNILEKFKKEELYDEILKSINKTFHEIELNKMFEFEFLLEFIKNSIYDSVKPQFTLQRFNK